LIDFSESKLEWVPDDQLLDLNLWKSDHIFFPWLQEEKIFSAKFEYEGDEMRGYNVFFHAYERLFLSQSALRFHGKSPLTSEV